MHSAAAALFNACIVAVVGLTTVFGRPVAAQTGATDTVWVNLRSRIYHCRGSEYFGKTARGEYMVEAAARARGNRANGGRACARAAWPGDSIAAALATQDEFGPKAPIGATTSCTLSRIVDGDTVYCDPLGAIRLIGIDAPEQNQPPHFARSSRALTARVPIGSALLFEGDVEARDRYNRRLGHLWHNEQLISWYMARNGWAAAYRYPPSIRYADPLDSAETWARAQGRGLWPAGGLTCRPDRQRGKTC